MFKVAITLFCLLFLPYLAFALPDRLRRLRAARVRYRIFLCVVTIGIFLFLKKIL